MQGCKIGFFLPRNHRFNTDRRAMWLSEHIHRERPILPGRPTALEQACFTDQVPCRPSAPPTQHHVRGRNRTRGKQEQGFDQVMLRDPPTVPRLLPKSQGRPDLFGHGGNEVSDLHGQATSFPFDGDALVVSRPGQKGWRMFILHDARGPQRIPLVHDGPNQWCQPGHWTAFPGGKQGHGCGESWMQRSDVNRSHATPSPVAPMSAPTQRWSIHA